MWRVDGWHHRRACPLLLTQTRRDRGKRQVPRLTSSLSGESSRYQGPAPCKIEVMANVMDCQTSQPRVAANAPAEKGHGWGCASKGEALMSNTDKIHGTGFVQDVAPDGTPTPEPSWKSKVRWFSFEHFLRPGCMCHKLLTRLAA
jgi:hypothetical protein